MVKFTAPLTFQERRMIIAVFDANTTPFEGRMSGEARYLQVCLDQDAVV